MTPRDAHRRREALSWIDNSGERGLQYVIRRAVSRLRELRKAKAELNEKLEREAQRLDMHRKWSRALKRYEEAPQ